MLTRVYIIQDLTSKFGELISPAEVALICLKFILSSLNFVHLLLSYGLFVDLNQGQ